MNINPFKYGRIVSEKNFCPRPSLEKTLISSIHSRQNIFLEGERRVGKSSLIYETLRREKSTNYLFIDLLEIKTLDELVRRIMKAIATLEQKKGKIGRLFQALAYLKPVMTYDPMSGLPALSLDATTTIKPESLEGIFDFIATMNKRKTFVVVFDEFQDVLNLKDAYSVLAIMRSKVQFQSEISYIFAGSIRNNMSQIFHDPESPFFKSTLTIEIDEIEKNEFRKFLIKKFKPKKVEKSLLERIFTIAGNIPGDVQQLCGAIWETSEKNIQVNEEIIPEALQLIYSRELKGYETALALLTGHQLRCLTGLARVGGKSPLSATFITASGIAQPSSITKALNRLITLRIIYRHKNEYKFINPFFRTWLLYKNF